MCDTMLSPSAPAPFTPQLVSDYFFNDPPSPTDSPQSESHSPPESPTALPQSRFTSEENDDSADAIDDHKYPPPKQQPRDERVSGGRSVFGMSPRTPWGQSPSSSNGSVNAALSQSLPTATARGSVIPIVNASTATTAAPSGQNTPISSTPPITAPKAIRAQSTGNDIINNPSHTRSYSTYNNAGSSHPFRPFSGQSGSTEYVGPFVLGAVLGRGCTGIVRLGTHKQTQFQVAFKIIDKQYLNSDIKLWNKVKREIAILKLIEHPHVLRLYDVLETEHRLYLVLEHVKGGELFDYIVSRGRLDRHESLRLTAQIVMGLSYCHSHRIAHRDLKPENLLLDEQKNIKIADFGMAQLMRKDAILKTSCGSPHYASPEIIEGQQYDARVTDVWSIGVILYALITGSLPFDHDNIPTLLSMVTKGQYTTPAHVPSDVAHLISRMLTVDPDKRIRLNAIKNHPCYRGTDFFHMSRTASWPYLADMGEEGKESDADSGDEGEEMSKQQQRHAGGNYPVLGYPSQSSTSSPRDRPVRARSQAKHQSRDFAQERDSLPSPDNDDSPHHRVDDSVLTDLEALGLGFGNREELVRKISSPSTNEENLEQRFYRLLKQRRNSRLEQLAVLSPKSTPRRNSVGSVNMPVQIGGINTSATNSPAFEDALELPAPAVARGSSRVPRHLASASAAGTSAAHQHAHGSRPPISPLSLLDDENHYATQTPPIQRLHSAPDYNNADAQMPMDDALDRSPAININASLVPPNMSAAAYYSMVIRDSPIASNSLPPSPTQPGTRGHVIPQSAPNSPRPSGASAQPSPYRTPNGPNVLPSTAQQRSRASSAVVPNRSPVIKQLFPTDETARKYRTMPIQETSSALKTQSSSSAGQSRSPPTTPILPAKEPSRKSWFTSFFSRRSSDVNVTKAPSAKDIAISPPTTQMHNAMRSAPTNTSEVISPKSTLTIANDVRRVLKSMHVAYTSRPGYVFDCTYQPVDTSAAHEHERTAAELQQLKLRRRRSTSSMEDNEPHTETNKRVSARRAVSPPKTQTNQDAIRQRSAAAAAGTPLRLPPNTARATSPNPPLPLTTPRHSVQHRNAVPQHKSPAEPKQQNTHKAASPSSATRQTRPRTASADSDPLAPDALNAAAAGAAAAKQPNSSDASSSTSPSSSPPLASASSSKAPVRLLVEIIQNNGSDFRCVRFTHVSGDTIIAKQVQSTIVEALKL